MVRLPDSTSHLCSFRCKIIYIPESFSFNTPLWYPWYRSRQAYKNDTASRVPQWYQRLQGRPSLSRFHLMSIWCCLCYRTAARLQLSAAFVFALLKIVCLPRLVAVLDQSPYLNMRKFAVNIWEWRTSDLIFRIRSAALQWFFKQLALFISAKLLRICCFQPQKPISSNALLLTTIVVNNYWSKLLSRYSIGNIMHNTQSRNTYLSSQVGSSTIPWLSNIP